MPDNLANMIDPLDDSRCIRPDRDWGLYLNTFQWDHVAHLTTRKPTTKANLLRLFLNAFVRRTAHAARRPVPYFYAIEEHVSGAPHLHALLAGSKSLTIRGLERRWRFGFARVLVYDPARRASHYVSKSLLSGSAEYDVSRRLPPLCQDANPAQLCALYARAREA